MLIASRPLSSRPHSRGVRGCLIENSGSGIGVDNLLFGLEDFENPDGSALFAEFRGIDDSLTRRLASALSLRLPQKPMENTPPLEVILSGSSVSTWVTSVNPVLASKPVKGPSTVERLEIGKELTCPHCGATIAALDKNDHPELEQRERAPVSMSPIDRKTAVDSTSAPVESPSPTNVRGKQFRPREWMR